MNSLDPTKDLFEREELARIWDFLDERATLCPGSKWTMFRAMIGVLSRVGCRITEACMLTVGDCELEHDPPFLRVQRLKKKNETIDPLLIDEILADWIREWLEYRPDATRAPLFVKPVSGKPWNRIEFHQAWKRLLREIDVPYRRPHALRHTHLTDYQSITGDIAMTMKRAGHTSTRTTMRYVDPRLTDRAKAINALPGLYEQPQDGNVLSLPLARTV